MVLLKDLLELTNSLSKIMCSKVSDTEQFLHGHR